MAIFAQNIKNMSKLLTLWLCLAAVSTGAQNAWQTLQQLTGTWKDLHHHTVEQWVRTAPDTLQGTVYILTQEGSFVRERMTLFCRPDGRIVYRTPAFKPQADAIVDFPLVFFSASSWTFENEKNAFPSAIEYWLLDSTTVRVTMSGLEGEPMERTFSRVSEEILRPRPSLRGYEVLVCNRKGAAIERFDAYTGEYLGRLYAGAVHHLCAGSSNYLYAAVMGTQPSVLRIDLASPGGAQPFSSGYSLQAPACLAFGPDGHLYTAEKTGEVLCFDGTSGRFVRKVAEGLADPVALAWDERGQLYAACAGGRGVWLVPLDGSAGRCVTPERGLKAPTSLGFTPSGEMVVADADEISIKRFRRVGDTWAYAGPLATGFGWAEGLAVGPDGFLYGCDARMNLVKKIDPSSGDDVGIYLGSHVLNGPASLVFWKKNGK